jgi:hypothetical protein
VDSANHQEHLRTLGSKRNRLGCVAQRLPTTAGSFPNGLPWLLVVALSSLLISLPWRHLWLNPLPPSATFLSLSSSLSYPSGSRGLSCLKRQVGVQPFKGAVVITYICHGRVSSLSPSTRRLSRSSRSLLTHLLVHTFGRLGSHSSLVSSVPSCWSAVNASLKVSHHVSGRRSSISLSVADPLPPHSSPVAYHDMTFDL